jgi:hypothetical protein
MNGTWLALGTIGVLAVARTRAGSAARLHFIALTTKKELEKEGENLLHQVGDPYWVDQVKKGNVQIYSMRNKNNHPVITITVKNNEIIGAFGMLNRWPSTAEKSLIETWAEKNGFSWAEGLGARYYKRGYATPWE